MNGLEQIQENIEKFICERKQTQRKIMEIEKTRAQLAERRNQKKKTKTNNDEEIKEIGKQISELGNQILRQKRENKCVY